MPCNKKLITLGTNILFKRHWKLAKPPWNSCAAKKSHTRVPFTHNLSRIIICTPMSAEDFSTLYNEGLKHFSTPKYSRVHSQLTIWSPNFWLAMHPGCWRLQIEKPGVSKLQRASIYSGGRPAVLFHCLQYVLKDSLGFSNCWHFQTYLRLCSLRNWNLVSSFGLNQHHKATNSMFHWSPIAVHKAFQIPQKTWIFFYLHLRCCGPDDFVSLPYNSNDLAVNTSLKLLSKGNFPQTSGHAFWKILMV